MKLEHITDSFLGLAIGDALGVPVEFQSRSSLRENPVTGMQAYGSHRQPLGTWSDDSSLAFCLAETLAKGYDLTDLASRFINWQNHNYWTPHGHVFDIGITTSYAIQNLARGIAPIDAGGKTIGSNGNGSLMRILPLLFCIYDRPIKERFELIKEVSSLTHAHIISVISCFYYLEFARFLLKGEDKFSAFNLTKNSINAFLEANPIAKQKEIDLFHRLLVQPIYDYEESDIKSSGYVLHTLEASIWCLLNSDSYAETVLKAVNLGDDTDTTGAVVGGLAGILYGKNGIPAIWIEQLVRSEDIIDLSKRVFANLEKG